MQPISLRYYLFLEGLMLDLRHETDQNLWVMVYVDFSLFLSPRLLFIRNRLLATENFKSHEVLAHLHRPCQLIQAFTKYH